MSIFSYMFVLGRATNCVILTQICVKHKQDFRERKGGQSKGHKNGKEEKANNWLRSFILN
jgi:hypothetical protein